MTKIGNRILTGILSICLLMGCCAPALAAGTTDFDALLPLMDLVATAAMSANSEQAEVVGDESTTLTPAFINAFLVNGVNADASLGITPEVLAQPEQQAACLQRLFAAQLPELTAVAADTQPVNGYIGFQPVTVSNADGNSVQIIGELYWAKQQLLTIDPAEFAEVQWLDRALFSFRSDANALNGYRLTGFSVGSELDMETAMQGYFDRILVEYVNTTLGFEVQYPSVFTDDLLREEPDGFSATLPDNSLSFFAKRLDNANQSNTADYVNVIANGIEGAKASINDEFNYGTVSYNTSDGYSVFDVYIVTDKYVYQAELRYLQSQAATYRMYTSYLENSFLVYEVSVG